ncbi:non-ribosomal peptide synthetase [Actinokineospora sp. HUAS TT18]|uniref:non-ribosomal peptide synthetase n=1 Tax=Actinokineospora sp. HUAS TT18 TaxID=3447451 RepID=UPI003F51AFDD
MAAPLPVSPAQRGLWLSDQLMPESSVYNVFCSVRLRGTLDVAALRLAVAGVVERHEMLRSVFPAVDGVPVRRVLDRVDVPVPLDEVDPDDVDRIAQAWCEEPFDLAAGPLLRLRLLRLGPDDHVLCVAVHHIVCDGQSLRVFFDDLAAFYAGQPPAPLAAELPAEPSTDVDWWRDHLAGAPDLLTVLADRPRPAVRGPAGATLVTTIPDDLLSEVAALARRSRMTPFMVLLAGFGAVLGRLSGAAEVLVGSPVSNRHEPESHALVGMFVDTLPIRLRTGAATFTELLADTRRSVLAALAHQGVPFDRIVDAVRPDRAPSHTPLVQVAFSADLAPYAEPDFPGLRAEVAVPAPTTAKFDLDVSVSQVGDQYAVVLTYSTELYDADTVERITDYYLRLLAGAVADPDTPVAGLPLLSAAEHDLLVREWADGPPARAPRELVHELFARQAELTPDAPAISAGGVEHSYAEIDARANGLAARLRAAGVGPDDAVGVLAHRSVDLFVAILGILKADGAYIPLSPTHPPAYLDRVLTTAAAKHAVVEAGLDHRLPDTVTKHAVDGPAAGPGERRSGPDHLAYVLFTSGSTGEPKGVAVTHRGLSNVVEAVVDIYGHTAADRVLQFANAGFDITVEETFPTWRVGGCVVLAPEPPPAPERMAAFMAAERITFTILTSSNWARWAAAAAAEGVHPGPSLRLVSIGAEPVDPAALRAWRRDVGLPLFNAYGLTETTVNATGEMITEFDGARVPIGRPLDGVRAYVLDDALWPVPVGVAGELYLGGDCLARGYLGRPDLTAERFVRNPFREGERLHRSGDRARWRPDGRLEALGRLDDQLKVRGYRIEPGHIEAVLCAHPDVSAAVVSVRSDRLVGYVVPKVPSDLREHLAASLPTYLVPAALVAIPTIPVTANGKVDHRALPDPDPVRVGTARARTETERAVAEIWKAALGLPDIGVHDNFFEVGGTSLLLSSVHSRLERSVPLVALYEHPTIAALARHLDGGHEPGPNDRGAALRAGRSRMARRRATQPPRTEEIMHQDPNRRPAPRPRREG